jgi:hypothetical protein
MHISRQGVERYQPGPITDPPIAASAWSASFDGKATWKDAVVVAGAPTWLVAGPDVTSPPGAAAVLPDSPWTVPALKFANGSEVVIRDEDFEGDEQPPAIYLTG